MMSDEKQRASHHSSFITRHFICRRPNRISKTNFIAMQNVLAQALSQWKRSKRGTVNDER
jgi:hypothetical protein